MKDLTKGNIDKVILKFAVPIFLGQIIQLLYSITDTYIIGNILGGNVLASVGAVTPISDLIIGFLTGIANGFAVISARHYGARDEEGLNKSFGGSVLFGTLTSIVLTIISVAFLPQILNLVNIAPDQMTDGAAYIRVILLGMTFSMLYNVFAGVLRAMGDTLAPLVFLVISVGVNIILVYIFVGALHMGVTGASVATILSQLLSAILCLIYIYKKYKVLHLTAKSFAFSSGFVQKLYISGFSMGLMNSLVFFGTFILQSSINTFSTNIILAHFAARRLTSIFMTPFSVLGMAMAAFCSQNYGAGKYDRIKTGIWKSVLYAWIWCIGMIAITYTIVPFLIKGITSSDTKEVIKTGSLYLRVDTLLYFIAAVISIVRNALQGLGEHITPIISSGIELAGKALTVIFLTPKLHYMGIIISEPIVWVLMVIPLLFKLRKVLRSIMR